MLAFITSNKEKLLQTIKIVYTLGLALIALWT